MKSSGYARSLAARYFIQITEMLTEVFQSEKPEELMQNNGRLNRAALKSAVFAGLCVVGLLPIQASASTYDFVGRWMSSERDASGITGMTITPDRRGLNIRIFGLCPGQDVCDWQVAHADLYATGNWGGRNWGSSSWGGFSWNFGNWQRDTDVVTAEFDAGYARKLIVLKRSRNNELRAEIFTTSRDRFGRPGYFTETRFQRWGRMPGFDNGRYRDDGRDDRNRDRDRDQQRDDQ